MDKRFVKNWVLHIPHRLRSSLKGESLIFNLLPSFFFSSYETSFFFFLKSTKSNHFLLAHIPCMNESHDHGRPFKVAMTTSGFSASSSTASRCYAFWIFTFFNYFLKSIFELCSYLQIAWSRNQTSSVSLGNTLVVQVYLWLNQQWSSWPWSSSSCVRLWSSSPSRTGTSLLM